MPLNTILLGPSHGPATSGIATGVKLVAFAAELGQGDELKDIEAKACTDADCSLSA